MAVTIFHRVINNNRIKIVNNAEKRTEKRAIKVSGDVKAIRHEITETHNYD